MKYVTLAVSLCTDFLILPFKISFVVYSVVSQKCPFSGERLFPGSGLTWEAAEDVTWLQHLKEKVTCVPSQRLAFLTDPEELPTSPPPFPLFLYFLLAFCCTGKTTGSTGLPPRAFNWRDVLTTLITVAGKERNTPTLQKAWPSPSLSFPRLMWLHFPSEPHRLHQGCAMEATPVFKPILSPWKFGLTVYLPYAHLSGSVFLELCGKDNLQTGFC